jgi:hypothetical protein
MTKIIRLELGFVSVRGQCAFWEIHAAGIADQDVQFGLLGRELLCAATHEYFAHGISPFNTQHI